jgi:AraC-like DNA-binding protein
MDSNKIQSCHLGPEISPEAFIQDHFFLHLLQGSMQVYDGRQDAVISPGDYYLARKNHLVRYIKHKDRGEFKKVVISLDEAFLKTFAGRHPQTIQPSTDTHGFIQLPPDTLLNNYIQSLAPYYNRDQEIDPTFVDVKREELVLILLKTNPSLADTLFNFSMPEKIDLQEFMHQNFRFNVSLDRFAIMTGRSLSGFKRDFQKIFGQTPGTWLKKKRLEEAYFQLSKHKMRPGDVYLNVGFEDFSHFSYAFKKEFGVTPVELLE